MLSQMGTHCTSFKPHEGLVGTGIIDYKDIGYKEIHDIWHLPYRLTSMDLLLLTPRITTRHEACSSCPFRSSPNLHVRTLDEGCTFCGQSSSHAFLDTCEDRVDGDDDDDGLVEVERSMTWTHPNPRKASHRHIYLP